MSKCQELNRHLQDAVSDVVFGMDETVESLAISLVVRGHLLLQGVPGVGKTLLGKTLATALGGTFQRVQGTADLMPSDITGISIYNQASQVFEFQRGPVFADVILVDEINRAGPKTQSSLLEAMEERQVTVDRETYPLPDNFIVIATQNPRELEGTYPLPESQLDRFVMRIDVTYPAPEHELRAIERYGRTDTEHRPSAATGYVVSPELVQAAREESSAVTVTPQLIDYVMNLGRATRESRQLSLGISTRGIIALVRCARVAAAIADRDYATPDDIKRLAPKVIGHRLLLTPEAILANTDTGRLVEELLNTVDVPR